MTFLGGATSGSTPFTPQKLQAWGTLIAELILAQVALALGNISVLGVQPFAFLTQWGHDLQQTASDAYTGQQTANDKADGTATVLGLGSGTDLLGTLNPTAIWTNIVNTLINPLGLITSILSPDMMSNLLALLGIDIDQPTGTFDPTTALFSGPVAVVEDLYNDLVDGTSGTTGSTGKTATDALTALQTQFGNLGGLGTSVSSALDGLGAVQTALTALAPNAITALEKAVESINILGIRINKSAAMGANPTSQTSLTAGHFSSGGSLTTAPLTTATAVGQRLTVPEIATYGFVDIMASIPSGSNFVWLNIFKIDPVTNAKTALFNSLNVATLIPTSINDHTRILLPGMPQSQAGDELIIEIMNTSANTLTLATKVTGVPNNSHEVIQNIGWTRIYSAGGASPTSLTFGQGAYSGTAPYAVIGIAVVPADYHAPEADSWTVAGTTTGIAWPSFLSAGDLVDYAGIGGGGGGGSSLTWLSGQGGGAAAWSTGTLVMGTDIKLGSTYSVTVGARGGTSSGNSGSTPGVNGNGNFGGDTTLTYTDPSNVPHTITFSGGQWGGWGSNHNGANSNTTSNGQAAGSTTLDGVPHTGGASVGAGSTGQSPGAGGGGAIPWLEGSPGGVGELDLYMKQA
jgi:hypothetical protein